MVTDVSPIGGVFILSAISSTNMRQIRPELRMLSSTICKSPVRIILAEISAATEIILRNETVIPVTVI